MKKQYLQRLSIIIICGFFLNSCAVPIAPTGGPADNTAPIIEFTVPKTGTTNFTGNTFEFQFNEYINRSSAATAITVEPDLGLDYDISWKRRKMIIEFEDDFPDSTTIILKLSGDISDVNGNRMNKTTSLAISTGDEIDSGQISGKILLAENGRGAAQKKVLLYRSPVDFTKKANYEVSTDTSGAFTFSYLSEGRYQAILIDDRNRNKIWEQNSELAQPFYEENIQLEKASFDTLKTIYTTRIDTLKPRLLGVGLFSSNRLRLRFSETIELGDEVDISISDSTGADYTSAYPLYISPDDNFVLFAHSENPLPEEESFVLNVNGVSDTYGNPIDTSGISFTGSAQEDTTLQRIISANDDHSLSQQDPFIVTYAAPITAPEIVDSVVVIEGTVDFDDWPEIEPIRNQLHIKPQEEWVEDTDYQFLAWNPVTQRRKMYQPQIWDSTQFGDLELNISYSDSTALSDLLNSISVSDSTFLLDLIAAPDSVFIADSIATQDSVNTDASTERFYAKLYNEAGTLVHSESFETELLITNLPPEAFTLQVFKDENENDEWDSGTIIPYNAPEPYYVQRGLRIQEGFTSQVNIIFQ